MAWRDVELADDMALAELAAVQADLRDAIHHQHWRRRQLRVAGAEIAALARSQQVVPGVGRLRRVKIMRVGQDDKSSGCSQSDASRRRGRCRSSGQNVKRS